MSSEKGSECKLVHAGFKYKNKVNVDRSGGAAHTSMFADGAGEALSNTIPNHVLLYTGNLSALAGCMTKKIRNGCGAVLSSNYPEMCW